MMKLMKVLSLIATLALLLSPHTVSAGSAANGKVLYGGKGTCAGCHGITGNGDSPMAAVLVPKPRSLALAEFVYDTDGDGQPGSDNDLMNIIKNGPAQYGGKATMPGRADLSATELADLVAYIRTLKQ